MIQKKLPSGETVTAFPITLSQQFMFGCALKYGKGALVNNIGSGFFWQGDMDVDVMRKSVFEAIKRCETMRLRFTKDEKYKVLQYITEKTEIDVDLIDLSDMPLEDAHEKLMELTRGHAPMFDCELHMIKLVKLADNYKGILFKFQHLAMDAYSTKLFLKDVMEIYLHYIKGTPYPKPMRPYIPALLKELAYIGSSQHEADKKYWYETLANNPEPIFTDFFLENRLKKQREKEPGVRYCNIHSGSPEEDVQLFSFTEEETKKTLDVCDKQGLSVCAALAFGVRTALSAFNDKEKDISIKIIVNRRGSILEKKSGGMRVSNCPMRTIIEPSFSFKQAVEEVEKAQNDVYAHCSIGFMEMLALRHKSMPSTALPDSTYDSTAFSYQPLIDIPCADEETAKTSKGIWYNNGASMIPLYITVKRRASDNAFEFVCEYQKNPNPGYEIKIFYRIIHDALMLGVENPDISVGEILEKVAITDEERKGKK